MYSSCGQQYTKNTTISPQSPCNLTPVPPISEVIHIPETTKVQQQHLPRPVEAPQAPGRPTLEALEPPIIIVPEKPAGIANVIQPQPTVPCSDVTPTAKTHPLSPKTVPCQPPKPKRTQLNRDQSLQVLTLREKLGWKYEDIARHLGFSMRQVETVCQRGHPTPRKRPGRPGIITEQMRKELVNFVRTSKATRRMTYMELAQAMGWNVSEDTIKKALRKEGYKRYPATVVPASYYTKFCNEPPTSP